MRAIRRYVQAAWLTSVEASTFARPPYRLLLVVTAIAALLAACAAVLFIAPVAAGALNISYLSDSPLRDHPNGLWFLACLVFGFIAAAVVAFPLAWAVSGLVLGVTRIFSAREAWLFASHGKLPERCLVPRASNKSLERTREG